MHACCATVAQPLGIRTLFVCVCSMSDVAGYNFCQWSRPLHVTTLSLLCFHSAAAYMPVVHTGRMGGVVRTHGLQLHLLRYNTNTARYSQCAYTKDAALHDLFSVGASTSLGKEKQQSDSCQLFPCGDSE